MAYDVKRGQGKFCSRSCNTRNLRTTHGGCSRGRPSPLFKRWKGIKERCLNPNVPAYPLYGGRGITVCDEWLKNFANFETWALANGFDPSLDLDRIDSNGDYSPSNCRWADKVTNANNRRVCRFFDFDGERMTLAQASRRFGINRATLYGWYRKGLDPVAKLAAWRAAKEKT